MSYKNKEGYPDPTASKAIQAADHMPQHKRVLLINGKILVIGKKAVQFGTDAKAVKRRILQGMKARNPDGSVNYTEVLLV